MTDALRRHAPGVGLATAVALAALALGVVAPPAIGSVLIAIVIGLAIANTRTLPAGVAPGLGLAAKRILQIGVALLGARLTLTDVAQIGGPSLLVVLATMTTAAVTVALIGRAANISSDVGILLATGTAVCGNSAIVAAAPVIRAKDREVSYAVATITIFGTLALLLYPFIGRGLGMPDAVFGAWAGLAINDTSQVVAAGAAYSAEALEVATVVKLVRNALMAPVLVGLTLWVQRREHTASDTSMVSNVRKAIPAFVLWFIAFAVLRSVGVIGEEVAGWLTTAATVAITIALAAIGLRTRVAELLNVGPRPILVGFAAAVMLAVIALPLAYVVAG